MEMGDAFHAYIIDWRLPDMNGIEVTRRIRSLGDDTPIIIPVSYTHLDVYKRQVIMVSHDVQALTYATHILHMDQRDSFYGTKEEYMNSDKWKLFKNTEEDRIGGEKK